MKENIILIGGGGHCRSVIDVIESTGKFNILGILDQKETIGKEVLGYKIIGTDDDLHELMKTCPNFHVTVGHIKSNKTRVMLYDLVKSKGGHFPVITSPFAYVSKHVNLNEGTIIMHKALINANATIGTNCIINTGAVIEHDAVIEDHCHISTGAYVNGECAVKSHSFIGSRSVLVQGITVAEHNVIAAGSVINKSTEPNGLYAGNPASLKNKSN